MDGVLVIDKPSGMTSHDVVARVRKTLGTRKVGHGGTLDPDATGVLVVGVGKATRFLSYAQAAPKTYDATMRLGVTTSTQDASGEILEERDVTVSRDDVTEALEGFVGTIQQVPPMVSAVKVGGERLYKKAFRGEEVERPAREVTIYQADLEEARLEGASSELDISVRCSGGTYVRTLAHDLGRALGCGAHLIRLRRTASGGFTLEEAIALDAVDATSLRPLVEVVRDLPAIELSDEETMGVVNGRPLEGERAGNSEADLFALTADGELLGVYRRHGERLVADRVVSQ